MSEGGRKPAYAMSASKGGTAKPGLASYTTRSYSVSDFSFLIADNIMKKSLAHLPNTNAKN